MEVVGPDGLLYRIDRLIVDEKAATVVDFKTGGESDEYRSQVEHYMRLLAPVYPDRAVRGFLAYVDLGTVREVPWRP